MLDNELIGIEFVKIISKDSFDYYKEYHLRNDVEDFLDKNEIKYTNEDITDICSDVVIDIMSNK